MARRLDAGVLARHDIRSMNVVCPFCGAFHWMDERVATSLRSRPIFSTCCQRGEVDLPLLPEPPSFLQSVLEGTNAQSKDFRSNIRQYNMSLAFTSLGVTQDQLVNHHGGWVFLISGELCHLIGSLQPDDGEDPSYTQLYMTHNWLFTSA